MIRPDGMPRRTLAPLAFVASALVVLASTVSADPRRGDRRERRAGEGRRIDRADATPPASRARGSVSIGRPNRGRIENAVLLGETEVLRWRNPNDATRWGTEELVGMLQHGAEAVAQEIPGAQLAVGDLSRKRGGRFQPHRSHRSGRDVDVSFYMTDASAAPVYAPTFVEFRANGEARGAGAAGQLFDDARNWELIESWLTNDAVPVQWIFVSNELKGRLLAEGARRGASADVLARAEAVLSQPRRGGRHRDHFHVRIFCPRDDKPRCVDEPPFHPWLVRPDPEVPLSAL